MRLPLPQMIVRAALSYFAAVFAVAFVAGTVRTLAVAPRIGEFPAVALELPVILAVSWVVAGRVLRRWPVAVGGVPALLAMGLLAFAVLILAEAALAVLAFGQSLPGWLAGLATPAGLLGLAGQAGFALVPAIRAQVTG